MIESKITIARIQEMVAAHYHLPFRMMSAQHRERFVAWPRHIAMVLSREFTGASFPEIGRRFGNRDHTTVIHAVKSVERREATDEQTRRDLAALRAYFQELRSEMKAERAARAAAEEEDASDV